MIYTLIILVYIANVFLNRWLIKIVCKRGFGIYEWNFDKKFILLPIIPVIAFLIVRLAFRKSWFTGKH